MDWDDLRIFLHVARAGSLAGAAGALRLDPATLSRRLRRLEAAAGAALFVKGPSGYALTGAGQGLLPHAEGMEAAARAGRGALAGGKDGLSGRVRIGAPDGVGTFVLPAVCAALAAANPALELEIVALPRVLDLARREADMAVTVSPPSGGRLRARRVCDYHLCLAARADWAAAHPAAGASDLRGHAIGYIPEMLFDAELDFLAELGLPRPRLASNSASAQLMLLRAGAGAGVVHEFMLPHAPDLVRLLPDLRFRRAFHLVRPPDAAGRGLDAAADALAEGLRAEIRRLEACARA